MAVRIQIQGRMGGLQKHCTTAPPDLARLEVGTYRYLKNFRKGLKYQLERCLRESAEAREAGGAATAADRDERLRWIHEKQAFLDGGAQHGHGHASHEDAMWAGARR